jgi:hypothetical protein
LAFVGLVFSFFDVFMFMGFMFSFRAIFVFCGLMLEFMVAFTLLPDVVLVLEVVVTVDTFDVVVVLVALALAVFVLSALVHPTPKAARASNAEQAKILRIEFNLLLHIGML